MVAPGTNCNKLKQCKLKFIVSKDMLHKILCPLSKFIALLTVPKNENEMKIKNHVLIPIWSNL